jgi:hypothetical protein
VNQVTHYYNLVIADSLLVLYPAGNLYQPPKKRLCSNSKKKMIPSEDQAAAMMMMIMMSKLIGRLPKLLM